MKFNVFRWYVGRQRLVRWTILAVIAAAFIFAKPWWCVFGRCRLPRGQAPDGGLAVTVRQGDEAATSQPASSPATAPSRCKPAGPLAAEFGRQSALILGCNELMQYYPQVFVDIVKAIHGHVEIIGLVSDADELSQAEGLLVEAGVPVGSVRFVVLPLDSMWVRDYGPQFIQLEDGSAAVLDMEYAKVDDSKEREQDDAVPGKLAELLGLPVISVPLRVEGGNLLSNGDGLCVTTSAMIRKNIERGYDLAQMGRLLGDNFGFKVWCYVRELKGEATGHADMFVTFLATDVVLVGQYDHAADPYNAQILDEAASRLAEQQTSLGPMKVHRIPMPPRHDEVWRSYNNVIFANGVVLVPTYRDVDEAIQQKAIETYVRLLPGRKVIGIPAEVLAPQRGLLHCITVNVPQFVPVDRVAGATTARNGSSD